jgi:hypothetical protein
VLNTVVRFAGEQPCEAVPPMEIGNKPAAPPSLAPAAQTQQENFFERARKRLRGWFGR